MDDNKFEIILNSLLKRTQNDELNWKPTANSSIYLLVLNDSSITIEGEQFFVNFYFKNEKGETVESRLIVSSDENFSKASGLFEFVRRKALKSDETIDKILKQLNPESLAA